MTHDVFISYANEDKTIADAICANLESNRIRCWIAPRDITPGTKFAAAIIHAIDTTQLVVIVFSQHSDNSPYVRTEIERAFDHEKVIIPFRIENIEPSDEMQFFIGNRHWLDAMTPPLEGHINRLSRIVQKNLKPHNEESEPPTAHKFDDADDTRSEKNQKQIKPKSVSTLLRRFFAYYFDIFCGFLLGVGFVYIYAIIETILLGTEGYNQIIFLTPGNSRVTTLLLFMGFFIWVVGFDLAKRSQSPGKRLLKLEIGTDPTVLQLKSWRILRSVVKNSPFITLIVYCLFINNDINTSIVITIQIVLAIPLFFTEKAQAVHDLVTGTVVYYNPK